MERPPTLQTYETDGVPNHVFRTAERCFQVFARQNIGISATTTDNGSILIVLSDATIKISNEIFEKIKTTIKEPHVTISFNESEQIIKISPIIH
jgi:hypothetical protein